MRLLQRYVDKGATLARVCLYKAERRIFEKGTIVIYQVKYTINGQEHTANFKDDDSARFLCWRLTSWSGPEMWSAERDSRPMTDTKDEKRDV